MAKRFIDTEIFNDSWFMNLTPESKLFFIYLLTNCDHAGIIDLNIRLAEFQTGIKGLANSLETVKEQFGEKRFVSLGSNYYFLPNFIKYQYSNGLSVNVKAQNSVISRLLNFNINIETLSKGLDNSLLTVQDKDIYKDKDKDKDKDKGGVGEKRKIDFDVVYNTQWMESIYRMLAGKITFDELVQKWEEFTIEMEARDDVYRLADDYRKHFPSWVKIKLEKNGTDSGIMRPIGILTD